MTESIYTVLADITGISLFSELKEHPLIAAFRNLLEDLAGEEDDDPVFSMMEEALDVVHDWAFFSEAFVRYQRGYSFYLTLAYFTMTDDNPYTRAAEAQKSLPPVLLAMAKTDLARLGRIASFPIHNLGFHIAEFLRKASLEQLAQNIEEESRVLWAAEGKKHQAEGADALLRLFPEDSAWSASLAALTEYIHATGAGLLGLHSAFYWTPPDLPLAGIPLGPGPDAAPAFFLSPIYHPDPVRLEDLCGYDDQRSVVIANTRRFLDGKPANNLLLYGDRGTGKSATVKAVCGAFSAEGLKLVEIHKSDLDELSGALSVLGSRPQRFIIFIDDLSFESADDSFRGLKALLEGSAGVRPSNTVIYATSNRRHLVQERASGQPSGELRAFDTVQEQLSLADRFGLTVIFSAPSQDEYLRIAEFIAEKRGLFNCLPDRQAAAQRFRENAIRWERWFNGRSPRTAAQYVDWTAGGADFPWEAAPPG